jgi:hypothetical protein
MRNFLAELIIVTATVITAVATVPPTEVCLGVVLPITGDRNVEALRVLDTIRMAAEDLTKSSTLPFLLCLVLLLLFMGVYDVAIVVAGAARTHALNVDFMPGTVFNVISDLLSVDSAGYVQFGASKMYQQITSGKCANGTAPIAIVGGTCVCVCVLSHPFIDPYRLTFTCTYV